MWEQLRLEDHLGMVHVGAGDEICGCVPAAGIEARAEIVRLRAEGLGNEAIARSLNLRAVPTPSGRGRWWPETVRRHVNPGPWAAYIAEYRLRHPGRR